jgi:hypothetical protein
MWVPVPDDGVGIEVFRRIKPMTLFFLPLWGIPMFLFSSVGQCCCRVIRLHSLPFNENRAQACSQKNKKPKTFLSSSFPFGIDVGVQGV